MLKRCPRCSRKVPTIYAEGVCKLCVASIEVTKAWYKKFKRRRAAIRGWEKRRSSHVSI